MREERKSPEYRVEGDILPQQEPENLSERIKEEFADFIEESGEVKGLGFVRITRAGVEKVLGELRTRPEWLFDYLRCLTAVDWKERFEVVYILYSFRYGHSLMVRVFVPREYPVLPSVSGIWDAANWFEREVYDLFGIEFLGHPNLQRILLPEDWIGYPLRKDYPIQGHLKEKPIRWDDLFAKHRAEEKAGLWRESK